MLPAAERWFVATYNEALPLVKDPKLAEDMRGFIGQEATHADVHEQVLHEYMVANGIDPKPMLDQIEYVFEKMLAPTDIRRTRSVRLNHLCDRLWLIAAIEHYTAVLGDFSLNCAWDDHGADPTMVDLFRWHGSEEVEHRIVAHDVAVYFHDSYLDRIRAMTMAVRDDVRLLPARRRGILVKSDPETDIGWWRMQRLRMRDSKLGLAAQVPKAVRLQHLDVLPAGVHAGADGFDGAGRRLSGQLPRGPRGAPLMGLSRPLPADCRRAPSAESATTRSIGLADAAVAGLFGRSRAPSGKMAPPPERRARHHARRWPTGRSSRTTRTSSR